MFKRLFTLALLQLALMTPVSAAQFAVYVHGIVCEFCSYGVAKKVRTLNFIDHTQLDNGVDVKIENQMVTIAVRDNAKLDKQALFKAIESGGYKPVSLWKINANGEHVEVEL